MKITIKSEKFINAEAPVLTKKMLDWLFLTMWTTRFEHTVKKVDTIDIIANTAYTGSGTVHFYIIINKEHKFHKEYSLNCSDELQNPSYIGKNWLGKRKERWQWMEYFVQNGVDMGKEGEKCMKKIQQQREKAEQIKKVENEIFQKEERYKLYLRLKEEFEP